LAHWYQELSVEKAVYGEENKLSNVPQEIAKFLSVLECDKYTFHSFRRTTATSAADAGSSTEQLIDFFDWVIDTNLWWRWRWTHWTSSP
jgi:hypothetical protein